jgi:endonuclease/exonuclease/phosphatase family metal-dependent hydrolase
MQAREVMNIGTVLNYTDRAIIMGDFNLLPNEPEMGLWLNGSWDDADLSRPFRRTHSSGKLDYILVRRDRFSFGHDAYITRNVDSDHALIQGYPVFR